MFKARAEAPGPLLSQAEAVVSLGAAAARFFKKSPGAAALASHHAVKARTARKSAAAALKAGPRGQRASWQVMSRLLSEAADELAWAVEETERFSAARAWPMDRMCAEAHQAAAETQKALASMADPRACAEHLAAAKRRALTVEGLYRRARLRAFDDPHFVAGLKSQAVYRRLSQAAECLHKTADLIGEALV